MNIRKQSRRNSKSHGMAGGLGRALVIAVLLTMLVMPFTSGLVSADQTVVINPTVLEQPPVLDPQVLDPQVINPEVVDPELDNPPVLDDDPPLVLETIPVDPGLTPVVQDPEMYPSDLYINPTLCPADQDLWSMDYYGLASYCNLGLANDYELYVENSSGTPIWQQVIAGSQVLIPGIAQDTYWIQFTHPAGGGNNLRIICSADTFAGSDAIPFADLATDQFGGNLFVEGDLQYWCDAFIQVDGFQQAADDMTVYINKHGCPEGIFSTDQYYLPQVCQEMLEGIDFNLTDDNGTTTQTTSGQPAMATFAGVDGSSITLQEVIPGGYVEPVVFCDIEDDLGNDLATVNLPVVTDGAWTIENIPAEAGMIFCDVFNQHEDPDGGSIIVVKYECPDNYDFSTGDPTADCGLLLNGVQFNTTGDLGYAAQTNTGDSINGAVMFGGLVADHYEVVETLPAGMTQGWWWTCSSDTVDLSGFAPQDHSDGSAFAYDLAENEDLVCTVYNSGDDSGTVNVHKWECPEAYDASHDFDWYETNCTTPMEDVHFYVYDNNASTQVDYYTDANGDLSFSYSMGENLTLYEDVPAGYSDPVFLCKWGGYSDDGFGGTLAIDGIIQALDTPTNRADLPNGYTDFGMDCNFYNNPTDDQSVTVWKYTCPADYDLSDPQADCTQLTDGVDFHLLPEGQAQLDATTGDVEPGAVYFADVPTGNFKLWETPPTGTINTYVTCQWFDNYGPYVYQSFDSLVAYDGSSIGNSFDFSLAQGDEIVCQFYNVPEKTWTGGDLTIYKYWCDTNVISEDACELGAGVKFIVSNADGSGGSILTETGPGGFVDVIGLPAGSYSVTEKDYEWCKAISTKVDAYGNVVVEEGQETILTVFNCTKQTDDEEKKPPTKFPNTGAGLASDNHDDTMILLAVVAALVLMASGVALNRRMVVVSDQ